MSLSHRGRTDIVSLTDGSVTDLHKIQAQASTCVFTHIFHLEYYYFPCQQKINRTPPTMKTAILASVVASAAAFALGAVAALAASALNAASGGGAGGGAFVSRARGAVSRALEGAASDSYNDSLSALYQAKTKAAGAGTAADNEQLRAVLRELRDAKRAPDYGGGFAASSPSSSASSCEEGDAGGDNSEANASFSSSLERNVDAAVSAAEAAIRAAAGLVFRAGEKL